MMTVHKLTTFPFLFGRAFIEANPRVPHANFSYRFPFLFGRAFIEAALQRTDALDIEPVSLPFRKGFH